MSESFNIILEYGIRKTFTDYLDDVSTTFVGGKNTQYPLEMEGTLAQEMSNPNQNIDPLYGNRLERGDQRGIQIIKKIGIHLQALHYPLH